MQKQLISVDRLTGEVQEGCHVLIRPAQPKFGEHYVSIFQEAFQDLAKDRTVTWEQHRVLGYLLGRLKFDNFMDVPQTEIAGELDMQPSNVSRALRALIQRGAIVKRTVPGTRPTMRLSPTLGWKGKARSFIKANAEEKQHLQLVAGRDVRKARSRRLTK